MNDLTIRIAIKGDTEMLQGQMDIIRAASEMLAELKGVGVTINNPLDKFSKGDAILALIEASADQGIPISRNDIAAEVNCTLGRIWGVLRDNATNPRVIHYNAICEGMKRFIMPTAYIDPDAPEVVAEVDAAQVTEPVATLAVAPVEPMESPLALVATLPVETPVAPARAPAKARGTRAKAAASA